MSTLYLVATPIGNLDDMTLRAVQVLQSVKYIAAEDTRNVFPLLNRFSIERSKIFAYHKYNVQKITASVVEKVLKENCDMALISDAGTPCICDPGAELVDFARKNGISVVSIPGACAVTVAFSMSGFLTTEWAFLGFFPKDNAGKKNFVHKFKYSGLNCFVFFESPFRVLETIKYLIPVFPQARLFVGKELTKFFEYSYSGTLQQVYDNLNAHTHFDKGEYVLVLQPNFIEVKEQESICLQALIVDQIVKGKTVKEAIADIAKQKNFSKKELYQASLTLKKLF
ncbi:MAG: 16S rRNA (cytidine(1402)-2'-O)-methyltransferase [Clostridiales bacterium]|jgi:16S rRNA (cytidine1402-2'-O)-methyltransferase|nr:16S rRNA (cytidine(1402)-2'-O)-methyltransferase [Clostridiales bacterium]